ncbi:hypothetical protein AA106555_0450 [Neokomagataea thailandica NBRC 106555]|nr:hypothetical protein AA106555_0450 [Neokomagataea thailandica NBRC 106555]
MAFSILSLITISLTQPIFGELIIDPVETVARLDNQTIAIIGILTFVLATIGINISANFVSASFDFSNIAPSSISWRKGGIIASFGAIIFTPWNLYARPELIHLTLDILGLFIAPVTGILISEYYIVQNKSLEINDLYTTNIYGNYWYFYGFNIKSIISLFLSVGLGLVVVFLPYLSFAQNFTWFIGFFSGLFLHSIFMLIKK